MKIYYGPHFQSALVERRTLAVSASLKPLDGLSLLFVTDFHMSAMFPEGALTHLIHQAEELRPDLICLGGDYAESARDQARFISLFARLRPPLGIFAVMGNNDYEHSAASDFDLPGAMRQGGIVPLIDAEACIDVRSCRLRIAGLNALHEGTTPTRPFFSESGDQDFRVILAHYPQSIALQSAHYARAPHLGLAGHTHGGQFRVLGLTPYHIGFELFRRSRVMPYTGWTDKTGFPVLVSNGIGTSRVPFRINVPPMLHLITLTSRGEPG